MTHLEFAPYHNRRIRFVYEYPDLAPVVHRGVVIDIIMYNEKKHPTDYVFIPMKNLMRWKEAYDGGNLNEAERLQQIIDIEYITSAALIR